MSVLEPSCCHVIPHFDWEYYWVGSTCASIKIIAKVRRWRETKGRRGLLDMLDVVKEADVDLRPHLVNWEACAGHRMSPLWFRIHLSYSIMMKWCRDSLTVDDRMSHQQLWASPCYPAWCTPTATKNWRWSNRSATLHQQNLVNGKLLGIRINAW
jgi:hypothetical protein